MCLSGRLRYFLHFLHGFFIGCYRIYGTPNILITFLPYFEYHVEIPLAEFRNADCQIALKGSLKTLLKVG